MIDLKTQSDFTAQIIRAYQVRLGKEIQAEFRKAAMNFGTGFHPVIVKVPSQKTIVKAERLLSAEEQAKLDKLLSITSWDWWDYYSVVA